MQNHKLGIHTQLQNVSQIGQNIWDIRKNSHWVSKVRAYSLYSLVVIMIIIVPKLIANRPKYLGY